MKSPQEVTTADVERIGTENLKWLDKLDAAALVADRLSLISDLLAGADAMKISEGGTSGLISVLDEAATVIRSLCDFVSELKREGHESDQERTDA